MGRAHDLNQEFAQLVKSERLKDVTSHSHFNASWSELYIVAANEYLKRHDPLRKKLREPTDKPQSPEAKEVPTPSFSEKEKPDFQNPLSTPGMAARKAVARTDERRETEISRASHQHRVETEQGTSHKEVIENSSSAAVPDFVQKPKITKNTEPLRQSIRLQVLREYRGSCSYVDPVTGKNCGARSLIEVDHITMRSRGGSNSETNLRALCRTHNIMMARQHLVATKPTNMRARQVALNC